MLIGILGLSVMMGLVASIVAFALGQSFLVALLIYAVVGVATVLTLACLIALVGTVQKHRPEQAGFTR